MTLEALPEYQQKGYWTARGLHPAAEARAWKSGLQRLLASGSDPSGVKVWMVEDLPELLRPVMAHPGTLSILHGLIGADVEFLSVKAVFKNPEVDFPSPWHHDWFYWGGSPKISVWIALDDATPENGCLRVIPGSQLRDFPLTQVKSEKGFGNRIEESRLSGLPQASLPAAAGDAVFFSDRLVHSSHPNSARKDRWSLISTYRSGSARDTSTVWKSSWRI